MRSVIVVYSKEIQELQEDIEKYCREMEEKKGKENGSNQQNNKH